MAHFAQINESGIVQQVIVVNNSVIVDPASQEESEQLGVEFCKSIFGSDTDWIQTSYNNRIRKRFATIGSFYDFGRDAFIPPSPYPSWILNEDTLDWDPPIPAPSGPDLYLWNEDTLGWDAFEIPSDESQSE